MLLTLGCSFTVKRFDGDQPWPHILAKMTKKELLNISHEGVSNQWMFRNMISALQEYKNISLIVVSLTNWDRLEVPYHDYAGFASKTKSLKPKQVIADRPHPLYDSYAQYYNTLYYVDNTASYILAMTNLAESKGIPIIFIQPLLPFNNSGISKIKSEVNSELFKESYTEQDDKYIENMSLINSVNEKLFAKMKLNARSILHCDVDDPSDPKKSLSKTKKKDYDTLYHYFITWDPAYQLGYHNHDVYRIGRKFKNEWDAHPNKKGHKLIAETVLNHL